MKYAEVILEIIDDDNLTDADLEDIDIAEAVIALEDALPELPKGANWRVKY